MVNSLNEEVKDFISQNNIFEEEGDNFSTFHPKLKSWGIPNFTAKTKKFKTNSLRYAHHKVYACTYNFDSEGRRKTFTNSETDSVGLIFGDSIAFGTGVPDDYTLASYFAKHNPNTQYYNYGFPGHGPAHMLLHVLDDNFKEEFKNKKGTLYYILRDDAIKVSNGKVDWCEDYPKVISGEYVGSFSKEEIPAQSDYLASEFTTEDYTNTVAIFESIKNELKNISKDLELQIIILPSSFCNFELIPFLQDKNIDYKNLYFTDLEFLTENKSRFLDGTFKPKAFDIISKIVTDKNSKQIDLQLPNNFTIDETVEMLGLMMPSFVDYPDDDSGVICSLICKWYNKSTYINLHKKFKSYFQYKSKIIDYLTDNKTLSELIQEEYVVKPSIYKKEE